MGCHWSEESHFGATGRVLPADGMASQFWTLVLCCRFLSGWAELDLNYILLPRGLNLGILSVLVPQSPDWCDQLPSSPWTWNLSGNIEMVFYHECYFVGFQSLCFLSQQYTVWSISSVHGHCIGTKISRWLVSYSMVRTIVTQYQRGRKELLSKIIWNDFKGTNWPLKVEKDLHV